MMSSFDGSGNYLKTQWSDGDTITAEKMNKVEDALYTINDDAINNKLQTNVRVNLLETNMSNNYYTKSQVDGLLDGVSAGDVDLSNYYTQTETDNLLDGLETEVEGRFDEYYTKTQVDGLLDGVSAGNVNLSNYYTKQETYNREEVLYLVNNSSGSGGTSSGGGVTSAQLGIVNVKDYGAKGDGVTDDSAAIKAAIAYMCSQAKQCSADLGWKSYMPTLYFPHGKYLVAQKGVLNCVGAALQGYNIKGAGYLNSEILYSYDSMSDPDGGYLLVNGNDNWFAFSYIEDLTIRGTTGRQNFWQILSRDGCPQANRFRRVGFYNLNRCVTVSFGTFNYCADLFRFESCKAVEIHGWVFGSETDQNSQTVVHTFRDCDFENIHKYGIHLKSGGTIEVRGGSWIMTQNGRAFHFDDITGAGIGLSNRNISIYGTKFEYQYYNANDTNLDYYPLFYNNSRMVMYFYGCNFTQFSYAGNSSKSNYGYLGIMGTVYFNNCQIPQCFGIKTNPTLSVGMNDNDQRPMIKFRDCVMYDTLDKIVSQVNNNWYQQGAYADVSAEGCYSSHPSSVGNKQFNTQLNQSFGNRATPSEQKMVVLTNGSNPLTSLPCSGASFEYAMPQGAIITRITIYFRYMADGTQYTVNVTNPKGATLATANHTLNSGAKGYTTEVFEVVEPAEGQTSIDYKLKITGMGANPNGGLPGFVAVEYY